jgi:hypothetical protein
LEKKVRRRTRRKIKEEASMKSNVASTKKDVKSLKQINRKLDNQVSDLKKEVEEAKELMKDIEEENLKKSRKNHVEKISKPKYYSTYEEELNRNSRRDYEDAPKLERRDYNLTQYDRRSRGYDELDLDSRKRSRNYEPHDHFTHTKHFCSECGEPVSVGGKFCSNCGDQV